MAVTHPARKRWTYEDVQRLPDDGKRYELIDGELYELPAPNEPHQRAQRNIIVLILPEVGRVNVEWYASPTSVFLGSDDRAVEPDLIVFLPDGRATRGYRGIEGAPDLLIEILNPSDPEHDRVRKRRLYAEAGVREYWIVSPEARTVKVLVLTDGAYARHVRASGDELVTSTILPGLSIPASKVFA